MNRFSAKTSLESFVSDLAQCSSKSQVLPIVSAFSEEYQLGNEFTEKLCLSLSSGLAGGRLERIEILSALSATERSDGQQRAHPKFQVESQELVTAIDPTFNEEFPFVAELLQKIHDGHLFNRSREANLAPHTLSEGLETGATIKNPTF